VRNAEQQLVLAVVLFRVGGLAGMAWDLASKIVNTSGVPAFPVGALVGLVVVDSAALCVASWRQREMRTGWALVDLIVTAIGLMAWRLLTPTDVLYFMYPYSIIASVAFGVTLRRLPTVLGATLVLALSDCVLGVVTGQQNISHAVYDGGTYFPNTVVAFAVSRAMRHSARQLDASRAEVARLAAERQRLLHARVLHDRVLQTLESLAAGPWLADTPVFARVAEEAAWLRGFVLTANAPDEPEDGPLTSLHRLVERSARDGLRVQLHASILQEDPDLLGRVSSTAWSALLAAVGELLTNVRKHSGTDHAVMRLARANGRLSISVLDHGRGFDAARTPHSIGLDESVTARIGEVGGTVLIDTAPDEGTYVELSVPVAQG
jgi:signal transduction histidine kinase